MPRALQLYGRRQRENWSGQRRDNRAYIQSEPYNNDVRLFRLRRKMNIDRIVAGDVVYGVQYPRSATFVDANDRPVRNEEPPPAVWGRLCLQVEIQQVSQESV